MLDVGDSVIDLNMSDEQLARRTRVLDAYARARELERRRCEEDFSFFARRFWHIIEPGTPYIHGRHVEAIVDHLDACLPRWIPATSTDPGYWIPGQIRKLLIEMPPRHGKSSLVTVLWPAYVWTMRPEFRWLTTSYALGLAIRDSARMRAIVTSLHYQSLWGNRFSLLQDRNKADRFWNSKMGYRITASRDAGATGEGGDAVMCFPYEEQVQTELGPMAIGEIVERRLPLRVWSRRPDGALELAPITGWRRNPGSLLVRVDLPGGSFRSTPNHEIFTRSGWVASGDFEPSDRLPRFTFPDAQHDGLVDAEALGELAARFCGGQDLLDAVLGELRVVDLLAMSEVPCAPGNAVVSPLGAAAHGGSVAGVDPKLLGDFLGRCLALRDAFHVAARQLGVGREASNLQPSVSDGVGDVHGPGSVGEVFDSVLVSLIIQVSHLLSIRPWPDESLRNQAVYAAVQRLVALAQRDSSVSVTGARLQESAGNEHFLGSPLRLAREASHFAMAVDLVQPLESDDVSPLGVSFDGHCDTSYCLTVEPHHNFILCVGGYGIVVSNCDDAHNVRDADSQVKRDATKTWWWESMSTRKNNPDLSFEVVTGQRVHLHDLAAQCKEKGYEVLHLSARYDSKYQFPVSTIGWKDWRTTDGEPLWPERYTDKALSSIEETLGEYGTACQLQQDPVLRGGAYIKREWFPRISGKDMAFIPGSLIWIRTWDFALSKTGNGTASVQMAQSADGDTTYLRRGLFWHLDWPDTLNRVKELGGVEHGSVWVEAIGTTKSAGEAAAAALLGSSVVTVQTEKTNKVSEAMPWIAAARAKKLVFVEETEDDWRFFGWNPGPWIEHFLDRFCSWVPDPTLDQRDDEVDVVSLGYKATRGKVPFSASGIIGSSGEGRYGSVEMGTSDGRFS